MNKTAEIKLNGHTYTIHGITVGQLERITDAFQTLPVHKVPFALLRIVMERAEPKPDRPVDDMQIDAPAMREAGDAIIRLAGLQQPDANPPPETGGQ